MRLFAIVFTCVTLFSVTLAPAQTNIHSAAPYAWGENTGWVDFRGDEINGVVVTEGYLSGYAWCENVGWLFLGDGSPGDINNQKYTQAAGDTGVNNDGAGNLSGYGWGENIGWVIFDTSTSGGSQVVIDGEGNFSGYAWSENVGWINLGSGYGVQLEKPSNTPTPTSTSTITQTPTITPTITVTPTPTLPLGDVQGIIQLAGSGEALRGVTVSILDRQDTSDATGFYWLQNVPQGQQVLTASRVGLELFSDTITVTENTTYNFVMSLPSTMTPTPTSTPDETPTITETPSCDPGYNLDASGGIDAADLLLLIEYTQTGNLEGDFNCDGMIDSQDMLLFMLQWDPDGF